MERYENIRYEPVETNLTETINFLSDFKILKKGNIISKYDTINDLEIEFHYDNHCLQYTTASLKKIDQDIEHIGFGLLDPIEIVTESTRFLLKKGVKSTKFKISKIEMSGEITQIESNISGSDGFFRAAFLIDGYTKVPHNFFWTKPFKVENARRGAGYLEIKINDNNLGFFDYQIEKDNYLFVDCHSELSINEFEKLVESVMYSFALVSGCLVKNIKYILKFKNINFSEFEGFAYRKMNESVITNQELYNFRDYKTYFDMEELYFFPKNIFSKLAESCYSNNVLLRAIRIICQSRNLSVEIQAASIFVALETVKGIIIKENIEKITPFKDQKIAEVVINEIKSKIESLDDNCFNNKKSALNKVSSLNQVGNNESFKLAFELVGFRLTKNDQKCIEMRNRFLHGNMPYDDEKEEIRIKELTKISLSAHFLTCCLILKFVGYNGVVKNFLKYLDLVNSIDEVDEELFRNI